VIHLRETETGLLTHKPLEFDLNVVSVPSLETSQPINAFRLWWKLTRSRSFLQAAKLICTATGLIFSDGTFSPIFSLQWWQYHRRIGDDQSCVLLKCCPRGYGAVAYRFGETMRLATGLIPSSVHGVHHLADKRFGFSPKNGSIQSICSEINYNSCGAVDYTV